VTAWDRDPEPPSNADAWFFGVAVFVLGVIAILSGGVA
jgi:hypothetical protein